MAYSIHGRDASGVIDYQEFFDLVAELASTRESRKVVLGQVVAVTRARSISDDVTALRFISGSEDQVPVFYNERTGSEESVERNEGVFAVAVWAILNTTSRLVAIERKRPGVSTAIIERYLQALGRDAGYDGLVIDLNQVTSEEFDRAVRELEVVKKVTVAVNQPNLDWSDDSNEIHRYAEESSAASARVELVAPRGEGLSKRTGIVPDILGLARIMISSLKNVIVVGQAPGGAGQKTINLKRYARKVQIPVERGATADEELDAIMELSMEIITEDGGATA
ncbi:hypothetical protein [uncultured Gulosibacter sp.]|uniref:hypothetical protein n=1 Tax=uncultured Gulosibacter sp. TaxID=1339167 RepID=UPI00288B367C|nr:hypothetical protein [uncultured Gulosibacter sp.]